MEIKVTKEETKSESITRKILIKEYMKTVRGSEQRKEREKAKIKDLPLEELTRRTLKEVKTAFRHQGQNDMVPNDF